MRRSPFGEWTTCFRHKLARPMPDPTLATAGVKLVSGVALDAGKRLIKFGRKYKDERDFLRGKVETDKDLKRAVGLATRRLTRLSEDMPNVTEARLQAFLESPEAAHLIRQLYVLESGTTSFLSETKIEF